MKTLLLLILATVSFGCAYTKQSVTIAPKTAFLSKVSVADGRKLIVKVVDDRDQSVLGVKMGGYGPGEKIDTANDIATATEIELKRVFGEAGYTVVSDDSNSAELRVRIRGVKYTATSGVWTGGITIEASIAATASKNQKIVFEKNYKKSEENRVGAVPTDQWNSKRINEVISTALNQMVNDQDLHSALKK